MQTASLRLVGRLGPIDINQAVVLQGQGLVAHEVIVPAAQAGSMATVNSAFTSGTISLSSGHTITTGEIVDLYWGTNRRYGVTVGTVSGNDVPVSGGTGDLLPAQDADIWVAERIEIDTDFDGDNVKAVVAKCAYLAHLQFVGVDNTSTPNPIESPVDVYPTSSVVSGLYSYWSPTGQPVIGFGDGSPTNPLADNNVQKVYVSHGGTAQATVSFAVLYDSTP